MPTPPTTAAPKENGSKSSANAIERKRRADSIAVALGVSAE